MSGLEGFFGTPAVAPPPVSEPVGDATPVAVASESGSDDPFGVIEITTPSGIGVYYQAGPKRLYRLRQLLQDKPEFTEWREVPSMSTVTKILDKPGLVYWAEKVGINLVQEVLRQGAVDPEFTKKFKPNEDHDPDWWGGEHLAEIGQRLNLRNWQIKEKASDRGTSVHNALEGWAMSGQLADPDAYAEHERGFVLGINKFLRESGLEAQMSEVIVASINSEVAGRFDLLGRIPKACELTYHLTSKSEYRKTFQPEFVLLDLKTSKGVYEEYHLQVAGYRGCLIESGYVDADEELPTGYVLRVTRDGRYELVKVQAEWLDFMFTRELYTSLQGINERSRAAAMKGAK